MVTLEKTAAGLLQSLLFGLGRQSLKSPIIAENGAHIMDKAYPFWKRMLVGEKPLEVLKQRLIQGGLVGKGGLAHGAVAFSPEVHAAFQQGGPLKALRDHPMDIAMSSAGNILTYGLPAAAGVKHLMSNDPVHASRSAGEMAGWALGAPFGVPGTIIANRMADMAESAGRAHFRPEPPRINIPDPNQFG